MRGMFGGKYLFFHVPVLPIHLFGRKSSYPLWKTMFPCALVCVFCVVGSVFVWGWDHVCWILQDDNWRELSLLPLMASSTSLPSCIGRHYGTHITCYRNTPQCHYSRFVTGKCYTSHTTGTHCTICWIRAMEPSLLGYWTPARAIGQGSKRCVEQLWECGKNLFMPDTREPTDTEPTQWERQRGESEEGN